MLTRENLKILKRKIEDKNWEVNWLLEKIKGLQIEIESLLSTYENELNQMENDHERDCASV